MGNCCLGSSQQRSPLREVCFQFEEIVLYQNLITHEYHRLAKLWEDRLQLLQGQIEMFSPKQLRREDKRLQDVELKEK